MNSLSFLSAATMVYDKDYHFWDSPAVFLDVDSIVYIGVLAVVAWLVVRLIQKIKGKEKISIIDFLAKYMILCSLPIFILYLCQLIPSGWYTLNSVTICILPLVYGVLVQIIFMVVRKQIQKHRSEKLSVQK